MIPSILAEEFELYQNLRMRTFGIAPGADSRLALLERQHELQGQLVKLQADVPTIQDQINEKTLELGRLTGGLEDGDAKIDNYIAAKQEFAEMAAIRGVQSIEISKRGLVVTVFVRVEHEGGLYDFEDWLLKLWPGQRTNNGSKAGVTADCLRFSEPPNGDIHTYPRFRYGTPSAGDYKFCFGGHWAEISEAVYAKNYLRAVELAVISMHYIQRDRRDYISTSFRTTEDSVRTLAEQLEDGDKKVAKRYAEQEKAYTAFRLADTKDIMELEIGRLRQSTDRLSRRLEELQSELTTVDGELTRIEEGLAFFEANELGFEAEFKQLFGLSGVKSIKVDERGVILCVHRVIKVDDEFWADLGYYTLFIGPGFNKGLMRCSVDFEGKAKDPSAAPLNLTQHDGRWYFDFHEIAYDLDELCEEGRVFEAANLAVEKLFTVTPRQMRRLKKML